jgi:hypothetical protein
VQKALNAYSAILIRFMPLTNGESIGHLKLKLSGFICSWKTESSTGRQALPWETFSMSRFRKRLLAVTVLQNSEWLSLYQRYLFNYPKATRKLDEASQASPHWVMFLVQTETDNKVSLIALLEQPVKKLTRYFLQLEELLQFTDDTHPGFECKQAAMTLFRC